MTNKQQAILVCEQLGFEVDEFFNNIEIPLIAEFLQAKATKDNPAEDEIYKKIADMLQTGLEAQVKQN